MIAGRTVEAILPDWREAERMLLEMVDGDAMRALDARIALLREEHRLAMADREEEIAELATL